MSAGQGSAKIFGSSIIVPGDGGIFEEYETAKEGTKDGESRIGVNSDIFDVGGDDGSSAAAEDYRSIKIADKEDGDRSALTDDTDGSSYAARPGSSWPSSPSLTRSFSSLTNCPVIALSSSTNRTESTFSKTATKLPTPPNTPSNKPSAASTLNFCPAGGDAAASPVDGQSREACDTVGLEGDYGVAKAVVVFSSSPSVLPALPAKEVVEDVVTEEPEELQAKKEQADEETKKQGQKEEGRGTARSSVKSSVTSRQQSTLTPPASATSATPKSFGGYRTAEEQTSNTSRQLTVRPIRLRPGSGLSSGGFGSAGEHESRAASSSTSRFDTWTDEGSKTQSPALPLASTVAASPSPAQSSPPLPTLPSKSRSLPSLPHSPIQQVH
ncbi:hypothetical protein CVT26_012958 [Gymnopilus dilepis]|uniref:Uncharacterized protein n=1 Tax=Gymnopilus dilepis TaxID=231916 RepID=A0A409WD56_9AGAR|nr:hypothetical protein CVT26_012958 [Gymnopilus dilepis]